MKRSLVVPALAFIGWVVSAPVQKLHAQQPAPAAQKFEALAGQLQLTPQQKLQLVPILRGEAPKIAAIKADTTLSPMQKMKQLKAIHDQTDPQVRSILTAEQYQQLQAIRQKEIEEGIRKKLNQ